MRIKLRKRTQIITDSDIKNESEARVSKHILDMVSRYGFRIFDKTLAGFYWKVEHYMDVVYTQL